MIKAIREGWRFWSVKFAAVMGVLAMIGTAYPDTLISLVGLFAALIPNGPLKFLVIAIVGLLTWGIPTVLRLANQDKNDEAPK